MRMKLKPQWRPWEVRDARNVKSLPREGTSESTANPRSRLCELQLAGSQGWGCPSPWDFTSQHRVTCVLGTELQNVTVTRRVSVLLWSLSTPCCFPVPLFLNGKCVVVCQNQDVCFHRKSVDCALSLRECFGLGLLNNAGIGEPLVLDVDWIIFYICEMNTSLWEPRVECFNPDLNFHSKSRMLKTESLVYGVTEQ